MTAKYYLLVVSMAGDPTCHEYDTLEGLKDGVTSLDDTELFVFMFRGERIKFTDGPHRYLKLADGRAIPLFHVPTADDMPINETGYFGDEVLPLAPLEDDAEPEGVSAQPLDYDHAAEEAADVYGLEPGDDPIAPALVRPVPEGPSGPVDDGAPL